MALAHAIEYLLDNPARCVEMGEAGLDRARDRWSFDSIISRLEDRALSLVNAAR
jgi:glycosyltransferase involved in cell wall biosynthesis